MDLFIRQTPSFGLSHSVKHEDTPNFAHIESLDKLKSNEETRKMNHNGDQAHHHHHHHYHNHNHSVHSFPFHRNSHKELHKRTQALASESLPFISSTEVQKANGTDGSPMWIVIDDVVYNVTEFASQHPGGAMPLMNLAGTSCSWQFHKIHSKATLEACGGKLRIGRTNEVPNLHKEPNNGIFHQLWKSHHF